MNRVVKGLAIAGVSLGVLGVATAGGAWVYFSKDLPDHTTLANYNPSVATRVHAGDGRLVAEFASERRVFVPFAAIPKRVSNAFISAEDQNFYSHHGVDWVAVMRAQLQNVKNIGQGRRPIGASTITQQVTRIFLLSNEVSYVRKIKEAILAGRIEEAMGKDKILEIYMNEIFLGNRAYGVGAAALNYFNKSLDELTIAEAAFLASLPKAPDRYYRERHRDAAIARRNYVIGRMEEDGYISQDEAAAARAEPLTFADRSNDSNIRADYFVEEVRRDLAKLYGEQTLYAGGLSVRTTLDPDIQAAASTALRNGLLAFDRRDGWRGPVTRFENLEGWQEQLEDVRTPPGGEEWDLAVVLSVGAETAVMGLADGSNGEIPLSELKWARKVKDGKFVGPTIQKASDALSPGEVVLVEPLDEKARTLGLRQIPEVQGALVAMDPHTGRVLAMSGGFSARISVFNRATQALRQPGSAFKPFVYLAALDQGFTPSTLVLDAPFALDQGGGLGKWKPSNFSEKYYGPTPLRVGIEKSRNVMTVRLAQYTGMEPVVDVARRFAIKDDLQPTLSMALGAGETTVLRLTAAYSMLVNGGRKIEPSFIDRVQDKAGKTIYRHDMRECAGCQTVLPAAAPAGAVAVPGETTFTADPATLPLIPDMREQIADPRTVYQVVSMLEGVVQRGTGVRLREIGKPLAGKTGTTNDAMDAWFVGFSPDLAVGVFVGYDQPRSMGDHESGSTIAVPIVKDFMTAALKDAPATPFRVPPGLQMVRVDPETGQPASPGQRNAIWEGFIPGTEPKGQQGVLDGGDAGAGFVQGQPAGAAIPGQPQPTVGTGTGGVY
ncbi:penicillin-binding protein [Niveispirillum lacus]|uniref:Penicillin-binding protein 1A n=1 Tax=Niveispirillum lacus TaxID=1981099 RepID=A0A255YW54_9PROT|nr:penicillin-binding protein 1A [Niveispirillum lacus]OYQ32650.1 penicillin-binding protein [Niveispirillum lacus]